VKQKLANSGNKHYSPMPVLDVAISSRLKETVSSNDKFLAMFSESNIVAFSYLLDIWLLW
jgi:hypothetical protein